MLINTENFIKGSLLGIGLSWLFGGPIGGLLAVAAAALIASNANFYSYCAPSYYQAYFSYPFSRVFPSWSPFSRPSTHVATTVYLRNQPPAQRSFLSLYPHRNQSHQTPSCELVGRRFIPAPSRSGYRSWLRP